MKKIVSPYQRTYCNPLVLPDYPRGRLSFDKPRHWHGFLQKEAKDYRETADPSVIYYNNKWYLYPSAGMAYVSEDFITWQHHRIEPYDCGYAPTVAFFRNKFYLTACGAPLYAADDPLGPFQEIGPLLLPDNQVLLDKYNWNDPMLFPDTDGHFYAYWGLGGKGIYAAELDPENPRKLLTVPKIMFSYDPRHEWERFGVSNEDWSQSYVEGSWMFKANGRYYLTYSAPGTEIRTYAMGTYVSDRPLGPFHYQKRNPILRDTNGLVTGPGHGSIVEGPNNTYWAFYTCCVCYEHIFERRIGVDPAGFDEEGNLFVNGASEIPQWGPGLVARPEQGNDSGLLSVTISKHVKASSESPGRVPLYAIDNSMLTWWQPAADDPQPWIAVYLRAEFRISAVRLVWRDVGLDYDNNIVPGPFQYRLEASESVDSDDWTIVLDRSKNQQDLLIDYHVFNECRAKRVRLVISGKPKGIEPGLIDLSVFGKSPAAV